MNTRQITTIAATLFLLFLTPRVSFAQCPSVTGSGDPAVILFNVYGMPNLQYFPGEGEEFKFGMTTGIQLGAIFSDQFQLVAGAELASQRREYVPAAGMEELNYRTFFLEIPLEMRFRTYDGRKSESFLLLGAGAMLANVRETNDPNTTDDELLFHQLFARLGFEHAIEVEGVFNIIWGITAKVDPIGLANQEYSNLYGTYYGGLKVGIQLGL